MASRDAYMAADGSEAVVWVETHISQGACAYPITPSTNIGAGYDAAPAAGRKNLWGGAAVLPQARTGTLVDVAGSTDVLDT